MTQTEGMAKNWLSVIPEETEGYQMYLGKKCHLVGILRVQGMARIDGSVEGEIYGSDCIQVGKEGKIEASIQAKQVLAQGPLRGNIKAEEKVELIAPSTLTGQIHSPVFLLEEGVLVNGTLSMPVPKSTVS